MIKMQLDEVIKGKGMKKGYLANQMGVNKDTFTNWIKGKTFPRLDQAVQLADILGCKLEDLYERID